MSKAVQRRRGTTAEHSTFTGALGELTVDTTKDTIVVHDGAAAGGYPLLREDGSNSALALGSAGTPSLKWDTNTGIYSPGADQVAISTNGTGRLFVDAVGSVGIGHTPTAIFSVLGNARVQTSASGSVGYEIYNGTRNTGISSDFTNSVTFIDHNQTLVFRDSQNVYAERMRLDSSGRLGLGTSSPYNGRLTVIPAAPTPTTVASANQINVGEASINSNYRLQVGYFYDTAGRGSIQSYDNGNPGSLILNGAGGNVGIGTTSPGVPLDVVGQIRTVDSTVDLRLLPLAASAVGIIGTISNHPISLFTNNTERARIDSSGRLLVGASSSIDGTFGNASPIQNMNFGSYAVGRFFNDASAPAVDFVKSRNGTIGLQTVVQSGDAVGDLYFSGSDGTAFIRAAQITAAVDGTPGTDDMPGRLVFSTTADGASSPTERLRITSAGVLQVADAGNITVGTTTGTKIGTATTQKLGFFDKTPVVQPAAVADATDAASAITQLNALLARMRDLGLIAT